MDASLPFRKGYGLCGVEDRNVEFCNIPKQLVAITFAIDTRSDLGLGGVIILRKGPFQHLKEGTATPIKKSEAKTWELETASFILDVYGFKSH